MKNKNSKSKERNYNNQLNWSTRAFGVIVIGFSLALILGAILVPILGYYVHPLKKAIKTGDIEGIKEAISRGANVNAIDRRSGRTMLTLATQYGHHSEELLLKTPELRQETIRQMLEILIDNGADINAQDRHGCTALFLVTNRPYFRHPASEATVEAHKELVAMLIAKGADVNVKYEDGRTALHNAIGISVESDNLEVVELLIKSGADVNAKTKEGETPLRQASAGNKKKIAELLRRYRAKE